MAQVPYTPYSTAEPTSGGERVSVSTPPAAFGVDVAQAVQGLGGTLEKSGDELFNRALALQQLKNENDAREAQTAYVTQSSALQADFDSKVGKDAKDSLEGHIKAQTDLRMQFRNGLGSQFAQKFYDADTLPYMQRNIFSSARHAGDENKKYTVATMAASEDMLMKQTSDHPDDPALRDQNDQKIAASVAQRTMIQFGAPEDSPIVKDAVTNALSKHTSQWLLGMSRVNPMKAMDAANDAKSSGKLTEPDFEKIQGAVEGRGVSVAASQITDDYFAKHMKPDGTLDVGAVQGEKDVRAIAEKAGISPLLPQSAVQHFSGRLYQMQTAAQKDMVTAQRTLSDLILKNNITDSQQLLSIEGVPDLVKQTGMKVQADTQNYINSVQKQAHLITDADQLRIAKGMGTSKDMGEREKFLNTDFSTWQLNSSDRIDLDNLKKNLLADPKGDPRVPRAMSYLLGARGAALGPDGLNVATLSEKADNANDYYKFRGTLQEALEVFQEDHKRAPTPKEITDEIGPLIINGMTAEKHRFWFDSAHKTFQDFTRADYETVPEDYKQKIVNDVLGKGGAMPSELQIVQKYNSDTFRKLYGKTGSATKPSEPNGKPAVPTNFE